MHVWSEYILYTYIQLLLLFCLMKEVPILFSIMQGLNAGLGLEENILQRPALTPPGDLFWTLLGRLPRD